MSAFSPNQLTLGVGLDDDAQFENFFSSSDNFQLVESLQEGHAENYIYLWGNGSPGLSHLLQATCHRVTAESGNAIYLPLADKSQFSSEILQGTENLSLVCIDNIENIVSDDEWEAALFTAFNAMRDSNTRLVIASNIAAQYLAINLPDLHSRLQSGLILQLKELSDEEKLLALQLRARKRGFELSRAVAEFILLRADRSLSALMQILEELDRVTLQQQRKLTIPLVKSTLGW